jgi:hypothetical protein
MISGKVIKRTWRSGPRRAKQTAYGYTLMVDGKQERKYDGAWTPEQARDALAARILERDLPASGPAATRNAVDSRPAAPFQICGVVPQLKSDHLGINAQNPCGFSDLFAVQILAVQINAQNPCGFSDLFAVQILAVQISLLSSALPSKYAGVRDAWRRHAALRQTWAIP